MMLTLPVTPWGLEDFERSVAERRGQVYVLNHAELRSIIDGWKADIRRRQEAENRAAIAATNRLEMA